MFWTIQTDRMSLLDTFIEPTCAYCTVGWYASLSVHLSGMKKKFISQKVNHQNLEWTITLRQRAFPMTGWAHCQCQVAFFFRFPVALIYPSIGAQKLAKVLLLLIHLIVIFPLGASKFVQWCFHRSVHAHSANLATEQSQNEKCRRGWLTMLYN